jgi:uncharacterized protein YndB with AHSA1/START domain
MTPDPQRIGPREFSCFATADPAAVWSALTDAGTTRRFLYGLAAHSSWEVDAPIRFDSANGETLVGRVLYVDEPCRLTYLLQSGPDDPCTYLTWRVRPCHDGSAVRLEIDEGGADDSEADEDAEDRWLPVLSALQGVVARDAPREPAPEI